jgi:hypothetical protein
MEKLTGLNLPALEVLVDIARTVGERRYTSGGDSRDDWRDMCEWADEFEVKFKSNPDACETYMEDVEEFAISKAVDAGWTVCENVNLSAQRMPVEELKMQDDQENNGVASEPHRFNESGVPAGSSKEIFALHALLAGLEDLGFGTEDEINGADAVDAIAELYVDVTQRMLGGASLEQLKI